MNGDAVVLMADTFVRLVVVEAVRVVVWAPLVIVGVYLHARWAKS